MYLYVTHNGESYRWKVKAAGRGWRAVLWALRSDTITLPWRTIVMKPNKLSDRFLIRHVLMHAKQYERDGRLAFLTFYALYLLRFGYKNNPYEVEARAAEDQPRLKR